MHLRLHFLFVRLLLLLLGIVLIELVAPDLLIQRQAIALQPILQFLRVSKNILERLILSDPIIRAFFEIIDKELLMVIGNVDRSWLDLIIRKRTLQSGLANFRIIR